MASPSPLPLPILETLRYFDKYDYPLTWEEIVYWQSSTTHLSRSAGIPSLYQREGNKRGEFFYLPGRQKIVALRRQREKYSQAKWQLAQQVGEKLKKNPFIAAIFVTGALAMNNCPIDDDIDLMIVTYPNALWLTRFWVNLYLHTQRRKPRVSKAPDKICPNLWLDTKNLRIKEQSLYLAHEILQTKVLWEKVNIQHQFLKQNAWVKKYLPVAYKNSVKNLKFEIRNLNSNFKLKILNFMLPIFNWLFFVAQYLYMKPKMTSEKVGLGFAFFHPAK